MRRLNPTQRTARTAGVAAAAGFAAIAAFELALAAGAPLGHAAWGGAHAHLSTAERIASAIAVVVWATAALIVLGRVGLRATRVPQNILRRATWGLAGMSLLAAPMNFISPSRWEDVVFGPAALLLAILCTVVARGPRKLQRHPASTASPQVGSY